MTNLSSFVSFKNETKLTKASLEKEENARGNTRRNGQHKKVNLP
jgi:hypothetical protein